MPADGCGHHIFNSATALLSDEHRVIERVLAVMERLTRQPFPESRERWQKALEFVRGFADRCHHFKEEKVLFPALEEHGIPVEGPIGMMLIEHDEGREYVSSMLAALEQPGSANAQQTLVESAGSYIRLLKDHIQKEDDILFRMADDVIPADKQKQLLRAFEEHEANEIGAGIHQNYLKIVEELESSM
jgi:hemerythrin-like domain-containing protein